MSAVRCPAPSRLSMHLCIFGTGATALILIIPGFLVEALVVEYVFEAVDFRFSEVIVMDSE